MKSWSIAMLAVSALWAGASGAEPAVTARAEPSVAPLAEPAAAPRTQPAAVPFGEEVSKQNAIYKSVGAEVPDGYVVGRSLMSYAHILASDFKESMAKLDAADRWLDIGAGEGRAVVDYCTSQYDALLKEDAPDRKARAIAMSIEDRRTPQWYKAAASLKEKQIAYVFGKSLRDYSREELGQFQVITDVLGAFSYTQNLSLTMEKILGFLAPQGTFYTVLQDVHWANGDNRPHYPGALFLTELKNLDGAEVKVCTWLKNISCVEVTCEANEDMKPPIEVYRVRKVCDNVNVPALMPTHFEAGTPPERGFQVKTAVTQPPLQKIGETR